MVFQMMFFIITPALISGSLVERMKFSQLSGFHDAVGVLVYAPVAHWVWGGGFIGAKIGASGLRRWRGCSRQCWFRCSGWRVSLWGRAKVTAGNRMLPHNLPLCLLGVGMLWFGWYGFNAGSAVGSGSLATLAFVNTTIGAAAAMLAWMLIDQITRKEMTALGAGTGAVAGLVGITPACGFVTPMGAVLLARSLPLFATLRRRCAPRANSTTRWMPLLFMAWAASRAHSDRSVYIGSIGAAEIGGSGVALTQ